MSCLIKLFIPIRLSSIFHTDIPLVIVHDPNHVLVPLGNCRLSLNSFAALARSGERLGLAGTVSTLQEPSYLGIGWSVWVKSVEFHDCFLGSFRSEVFPRLSRPVLFEWIISPFDNVENFSLGMNGCHDFFDFVIEFDIRCFS